jgi:hypothetical protein
MAEFSYTVSVLSKYIELLKFDEIKNEQEIAELQAAIKVFRLGQGYLTFNKPVRVEFYKDL